MSQLRSLRILSAFVFLAACGSVSARAQEVKTVFVIAMENHNWTQPATDFGIQQIFQNPNAPFINSLVDGFAYATINGRTVHISEQVAYATAYHNAGVGIHPSEPNYIWVEAGTNFGVFNDADPFANTPPNSQNTSAHLATLLTNAGKTWRSYQEDIDLTTVNGQLTNTPLPRDQWTVPLQSHSGLFGAGVNAFNGSNQFNYAAKHNPQVFFNDSNGGFDLTPANPLSHQYAPLQQLFVDLANGTVADYNWITPDQYNDMHSTLNGGFQGLTGDSANIRQGDNFLQQIIPAIMASKAYNENGAIIIWWDETEFGDDSSRTIGEIVICKHAHHNVNGVPYASPVNMTHSSDLRTMQEIFHLALPFLGDANTQGRNDLSDLFQPGAVPRNP
jgi:hypothetical protein